MKVLYIGFFKSGTKSMNKALEILGYKISELQRNHMEIRDDWFAIMGGRGTPDDLKRMYEGYDAAGDYPAFFYWKMFVEAFPDVKLILTTRDVEEWIRSWQKQAKVINDSPLSFPLGLFSQRAKIYFKFNNTHLETIFGKQREAFSIKAKIMLHDKTTLRTGYNRHIEDVMKNAPRDKLLVYNVSEGWQPLCTFLGKPVPDAPFPHLNKEGAIIEKRLKEDEHMRLMYQEMHKKFAILVICLSVIVAWFFVS